MPNALRRAALPRRRRLSGWAFGVLALPSVTLALTLARDHLALPSVMLLYLLLVVAIAAVGGTWPALSAAVVAFLVVNWYFTPPFHTWTVAEGDHLIALFVFLVVAGVVSLFVTVAAHQAAEANRARAEAETLAGLAGAALEPDPLFTLVDRLRETFHLDAVAVLQRQDDEWNVEASTGQPVPRSPGEADWAMALGKSSHLALNGPTLTGDDRRVLTAFAAQLSGALTGLRLRRAAAHAEALARANELRTALLAAVSHDLRTPLASIKASVTSLRAGDVGWSQAETADFLATIEEETDRLNELVGNLLDMSRLQAGALELTQRAIGFDEVVAKALASLGTRAPSIEVDVPEGLPRVDADPGLLERALANLVANAAAWSPEGQPVRVAGTATACDVELRVIDHGPGIPERDRERVFQPFQRLGDRSRGGVGLGLAVSRGFIEAMRGELSVEETPGGGLTMVLRLPRAA